MGDDAGKRVRITVAGPQQDTVQAMYLIGTVLDVVPDDVQVEHCGVATSITATAVVSAARDLGDGALTVRAGHPG